MPQPAAFSAARRVHRRYHVGTAGLTYIFITVLIALGAFNSQNNLLFWAFGFSLSLLIVSGLLSGAMLMGIQLERTAVDQLRANDPGSISYRVTNRNRVIPAFALTIREVDSTSRRRWPFRRPFMLPPDERVLIGTTWPSLLPSPHGFVAHVGAGQSVFTHIRLRPRRRGASRLTAVLVSTSYPFGIVRKSLLFEQQTEFLVHPASAAVDPAVIRETIRLGDRGATPTRRSGQGAEFYSLREFRSGDGIRAIAWRPSARRGELLVRQTAAPAPVRLIIAIDLDPVASNEAVEHAISIAGSLIDLACQRRLDVGLIIPSVGLSIRPREGRLQQHRLLDELARLDIPSATARSADVPSLAAFSSASAAVIALVHTGSPSPWTAGVQNAIRLNAAAVSPVAHSSLLVDPSQSVTRSGTVSRHGATA